MIKRRNRLVAVVLFGIAVLALADGGGAHLRLALEDRTDPNPHQVALGFELAGLCLGVVISWSERLRPEIS